MRLRNRQYTRRVLEEGPARGSQSTLGVQGADGVKQRRKENLTLHEACSSSSSSSSPVPGDGSRPFEDPTSSGLPSVRGLVGR
jgi:hypothetical protein